MKRETGKHERRGDTKNIENMEKNPVALALGKLRQSTTVSSQCELLS